MRELREQHKALTYVLGFLTVIVFLIGWWRGSSVVSGVLAALVYFAFMFVVWLFLIFPKSNSEDET